VTEYFAKDPTSVRLTVSAVATRAEGGGEVLLMQRSDNGHWGLPGGHVDPGESVAEATAREVREETGWRVQVGPLIGVYSDPAQQTVGRAGDPERPQLVNLCFAARVFGDPGEPTTPEETLATGFFALDALPEPFVPIHRVRIEDAERGEAAAFVR
jgi:ADP-ribose pyrophosphatase YjhB (NUDIX family)